MKAAPALKTNNRSVDVTRAHVPDQTSGRAADATGMRNIGKKLPITTIAQTLTAIVHSSDNETKTLIMIEL